MSREIDTAVAKAMNQEGRVLETVTGQWRVYGHHEWDILPNYSTDISAAWQVVEWWEKHPPRKGMGVFCIMSDRYGGVYSEGAYVASFGGDPRNIAGHAWGGDNEAASFWCDEDLARVNGCAAADTVPMAICKAFLLAVGQEVAS